MRQLYFKTSETWREWLERNHDREKGVWLTFFKKKNGEPSIEYESAVEEALCFGWIDSIIKKIDETKYVRKFTPRNENSQWSELNKKRVTRLIKANRMASIGLEKIEAAKRNGRWASAERPVIRYEIPKEFQSALNQSKKAKEFFNQLSLTNQKQYIGWIVIAKRQETRARRISESIDLLEKGQKLGLR